MYQPSDDESDDDSDNESHPAASPMLGAAPGILRFAKNAVLILKKNNLLTGLLRKLAKATNKKGTALESTIGPNPVTEYAFTSKSSAVLH